MGENIFDSEEKMQEWLKNTLEENDSFNDLILNKDEYDEVTSTSLIKGRILKSYQHCLASLNLVDVISQNENISLKQGDILKPDFLLYAPETESIVIVELKNLVGPSRQVGTEVSAYASEIKSYIPFISDGDIINVIISPVYSTLTKHYIFHEIFWLQRNILCLEPHKHSDQIHLKIIDPSAFIDDALSLKLSDRHLGGYQICLYDDGLYTDKADRARLDPYVEQMKTAISAMAAKGNAQKNHGFAFLWKDNWEKSLAPYSITVLNFAPLQSLERLFHDESFVPNDITNRFIRLIINYNPIGHGNSLNEISKSGTGFLEEFCSPRYEGFCSWDQLRDIMLPRAEFISFHSWGIFSELYSERLFKEYKNGKIAISSTDPNLGLSLIDELVDPDYEFIDLSFLNDLPDDENDESSDNNANQYDDLPFSVSAGSPVSGTLRQAHKLCIQNEKSQGPETETLLRLKIILIDLPGAFHSAGIATPEDDGNF